MELKDIYELWDRFDRSAVEEMELNMHGSSFHLRRPSAGVNVQEIPQVTVPVMPVTEPVEVSRDSVENEKKNNTVEIKAPLVGTFYCAPSPDAEPFIKVGQKIQKGDVIGIIEAMKLMNEVVSDVDGTVVEILAEDGKMVEYDQVLVTIA